MQLQFSEKLENESLSKGISVSVLQRNRELLISVKPLILEGPDLVKDFSLARI